MKAGAQATLIFDVVATMTHNATSLHLPGNADIITAIGDAYTFESKGAGNWHCVSYAKDNGTAIVATLPTEIPNFFKLFTAGQNITAGNYLAQHSDGKVYILSDSYKNYIGIADTTSAINTSCTVNMGGINNKQSGLTLGSKYYITSTETWATKAVMTTGRESACGASSSAGIVYVIGGSAGAVSNKNEAYDPILNTWSTKANLTTARSNCFCGIVSDVIYVIGGSTGADSSTNEAYDTVANTWSTKTSMTTAKWGGATGTVGTKIYCIGGFAGGDVNTNYEYDTVANTWATKTAITAGRSSYM